MATLTALPNSTITHRLKAIAVERPDRSSRRVVLESGY